MDMLLNDRWEWFYENRLKHPSEEEEENVQKIDYHLVIKKNGIMFRKKELRAFNLSVG